MVSGRETDDIDQAELGETTAEFSAELVAWAGDQKTASHSINMSRLGHRERGYMGINIALDHIGPPSFDRRVTGEVDEHDAEGQQTRAHDVVTPDTFVWG
jgi:hypothetical protein